MGEVEGDHVFLVRVDNHDPAAADLGGSRDSSQRVHQQLGFPLPGAVALIPAVHRELGEEEPWHRICHSARDRGRQ
ncbi:MAG: hypothetical protein LBK95_08545 [Bifidobacteriaceae bacterium]|jgi:hypothetical protein|nr:hypothetical protein [Bifidobacteriaceae bacterium]